MAKRFSEVRRELAERAGDVKTQPLDRDALDNGGKRIFCVAQACPCRASVYFGSALCSWHDVAAKHDWPRVTAELLAVIARGEEPRRPEVKQAAWVKAAAGYGC